jgi:hypothetical protein
MALDILSNNKNSCNRGFISGFTEVFQHSLDLEVAPLDRCFLNILFYNDATTNDKYFGSFHAVGSSGSSFAAQRGGKG